MGYATIGVPCHFPPLIPFSRLLSIESVQTRCSTQAHLALRASLSCLGSFSEVIADKFSSLISVPSLSIFLRPLAPAIVTRLRSVWLVLAASQFACATTDALTPASARFFGRSSRHELRSLPHRQVSHVCRLSLRPPFHHQPPDKPQQRPFTVLGESHWFRSLRTWLRSSLAVSPTCLAESCSLALRTGLSRTRLLQTMPRGIALTLCFLFSHGLTMQDIHLR